jgi:hypothetical protein
MVFLCLFSFADSIGSRADASGGPSAAEGFSMSYGSPEYKLFDGDRGTFKTTNGALRQGPLTQSAAMGQKLPERSGQVLLLFRFPVW